MLRLVQLTDGHDRCVAIAGDEQLTLLEGISSTYALAQQAVTQQGKISALIARFITSRTLDYHAVYAGQGAWRLLLPIDHPHDEAHCIVTGTGLTHLGSARNRQAMHDAGAREITDSMRMFQSGVEAGKPAPGKVGVAPEWFYKGDGSILRACGQDIEMPAFAEDGGEEAEVAGVYLIAADGTPHRVGMSIGNEFSDHVFEKKNYLNLAGSKLRQCAIGPELIIGHEFQSAPGESRIERNGKTIWSKSIRTGEAEMCHSLNNIEHHHFKFPVHRRPGDVHIHYYGADALSFGDNVKLADGDEMIASFTGFGRALRNRLRRGQETQAVVTAPALL